MSRLSDNLQRLSDAAEAIKTAIINKGGTVSQGDYYEDFASDILTIPPTKSVYAFLYVTTSSGATVTVSKNGESLPSQSGEELMFEIPESGTWTITAVKSGETDVSKSISIGEQKDYYLNANFTKIYGVSWDKSSSTILSRTDDSAASAAAALPSMLAVAAARARTSGCSTSTGPSPRPARTIASALV